MEIVEEGSEEGDEELIALIRKNKGGKIKEPKEISQGSTAQTIHETLVSTTNKSVKKKKKVTKEKVDESTTLSQLMKKKGPRSKRAKKDYTIFNEQGDNLFYFLPLMPFLQALLHRDLSFITWNFKSYPNMKVMAQKFP